MTLYYLPLPQNPTAYVWDDVKFVLYSAVYGQRNNSPNGLYQLKQGKDSFNRMGYKVSMYFKGPRRFYTIDELHASILTAKKNNKLMEYGMSSQLDSNTNVIELPEKRFLVVGCNPEFISREEAIEHIRMNANNFPSKHVIVEVKSAEQVTSQLQKIITDVSSIEL